MNKEKVIQKLRDDEHYYGKFGRQYFSNSDVGTLINNPEAYGKPSVNNINFVLGGYLGPVFFYMTILRVANILLAHEA